MPPLPVPSRPVPSLSPPDSGCPQQLMALNHISCLLLSARAGPGLLDSCRFLCFPFLWPGSSVVPALLPRPGSVEPPWEPCGISGSWGCQGLIHAPCPHSPATGGPPSPQTPGPGRLRGHEPHLPCASLKVLTSGRLWAPIFGHGDTCASSPITGFLKHHVVVLLVGKHVSQQCHLSCCEEHSRGIQHPRSCAASTLPRYGTSPPPQETPARQVLYTRSPFPGPWQHQSALFLRTDLFWICPMKGILQ